MGGFRPSKQREDCSLSPEPENIKSLLLQAGTGRLSPNTKRRIRKLLQILSSVRFRNISQPCTRYFAAPHVVRNSLTAWPKPAPLASEDTPSQTIDTCRESRDMSGWCRVHLRAACTVHRHAEAGQQVAAILLDERFSRALCAVEEFQPHGWTQLLAPA